MADALYNPEEAGKKLAELDALVPQVAAALHQDKFKQVQVRVRVRVLGGAFGSASVGLDGRLDQQRIPVSACFP